MIFFWWIACMSFPNWYCSVDFDWVNNLCKWSQIYFAISYFDSCVPMECYFFFLLIQVIIFTLLLKHLSKKHNSISILRFYRSSTNIFLYLFTVNFFLSSHNSKTDYLISSIMILEPRSPLSFLEWSDTGPWSVTTLVLLFLIFSVLQGVFKILRCLDYPNEMDPF